MQLCSFQCSGIFGSKKCFVHAPIKTTYAPVDICTKYSGDGAAVYVVGDTALIGSSSLQQMYNPDSALASYLGNDALPTQVEHGVVYYINGTAQVITRAIALKSQCPTPPLVGIALKEGTDNITTQQALNDLIGQPGTNFLNPDDSRRGKLHKFFFKSTQMDYAWRVANGKPDSYPGEVDVLLQEWYPTCNEGIAAEINNRIAFSRAFLSNFSKPSLIWKFHFPSGSSCNVNPSGTSDNYNYFMEYLFNHTGDMVDAGIIGVIYDSWMTLDGRGYGNYNMTIAGGNIYTGLTLVNATGRLDDAVSGKTNTPFCTLQKNSKAVLGLMEYTYGQKLYSQNTTCFCAPCTDNDYATGRCNRYAVDSPIPAQAYCNDGTPCQLPSEGWSNYSKYYCPPTCVNATACKACNSSDFSGKRSFCRIEQVGEPPFVANRSYSELTASTIDSDWAFVAGLPAKDKCCVEKKVEDQPSLEYTYVSHYGSKARSEFLQYPSRGEAGIDCGRTPDTSVLMYCGVKIPISQQKIACTQVG